MTEELTANFEVANSEVLQALLEELRAIFLVLGRLHEREQDPTIKPALKNCLDSANDILLEQVNSTPSVREITGLIKNIFLWFPQYRSEIFAGYNRPTNPNGIRFHEPNTDSFFSQIEPLIIGLSQDSKEELERLVEALSQTEFTLD